VFLHGFTAHRRLYDEMLRKLDYRGFRVTAIDLPGHGDTDPLHEGEGFQHIIDTVLMTVTRLQLDQFVIAGHSLGGRVAAEFAAYFPGYISSVLLLDAAVGEPFDEAMRETSWRWFPRVVAALTPPSSTASAMPGAPARSDW
jgi:pimeloyl-ACP methyl ester carboxylesterase